ncbi:MAG: hypothetical protein KGJ75_10495 [Alphaproteobacteria bacterium]|nr:hypothetical protein [Alphaproteobacteria bacterium]
MFLRGTTPAGAIPAESGPAAAGAQDGVPAGTSFGVRDLVRVMRERQRLIVVVALSVLALTLLVLAVLPTVYSASAVVMLDQRKNNVADLSAVLSELPTDTASLQNQIQILTSRDLAGTVVDRLDLIHDPEFNPAAKAAPHAPSLNPLSWFGGHAAPDAPGQREAAIDALLHHLSVDAIGLSTSMDVRVTASSAEKAARVANAVADAYVAGQVRMKSAAADKATAWLTRRVAQLSDQVQAADAAVENYKVAHSLNLAADGTSLTDQQLATISTQLVQAQADLAAKEASYNRIKALVASGHAADVSQVVASPLIVQLRTQEADLTRTIAEYATRYGPLHPKMVAAKSQRRDLENKLNMEVERIEGSLESDVEEARAQIASLNDSFRRTEREAATQNLTMVKLKALQADAASTRSMYESFVTRLRQTQDQEAIQMPDARVISPAPVPAAPSGPHRVLIFAAAVPVSLLLGLLAALLAERYRLPLATAATQKREPKAAPVRVPVFARVKDAASVRAADAAIDWPGSAFVQGMADLMQTLVAPPRGARPRVVALTALNAEEGKTAVALGLARIAARSGWKVVLVDGDLSRAPVAHTLGCRRIVYGILDAMRGSAPLSHCFVKDPRSGALLLSNLAPVANADAVWTSQVARRLFAHLRDSADLVLVDATPLTQPGQAQALLRQADAVLLVADPRRTPEAAVDAAGRTLAAMQAPPARVVLVE